MRLFSAHHSNHHAALSEAIPSVFASCAGSSLFPYSPTHSLTYTGAVRLRRAGPRALRGTDPAAGPRRKSHARQLLHLRRGLCSTDTPVPVPGDSSREHREPAGNGRARLPERRVLPMQRDRNGSAAARAVLQRSSIYIIPSSDEGRLTRRKNSAICARTASPAAADTSPPRAAAERRMP